MVKYLEQFEKQIGSKNHDILIVKTQKDFADRKICFSVSDRKYIKKVTELEQNLHRCKK